MKKHKTIYIGLSILAILVIISCTQREKKGDNPNTNSADTVAVVAMDDSEKYIVISHDEILERMQQSTTKMQNITSETAYMTFNELLDGDLVRLLSFNLSAENPLADIIKHYGEPIKKTIDVSTAEDDGKWFREFGTYTFPEFTVSTFNEYPEGDQSTSHGSLIGISTSSVGFGFGGIYVGVPECNKSYVKKLFSKVDVSDIEYENYNQAGKLYDDSMGITLYLESYSLHILVIFDEKDVVSEVSYRVSGII